MNNRFEKHSQQTDPTKATSDNLVIPAKTLLTGAAATFGAGILGAIAYTKRKQSKQVKEELKNSNLRDFTTLHKQPQRPPEMTMSATTANYSRLPPNMTAAEYAVAKKEASFFALKTFGYGTLLAFTGAGVLAYTVGWWLNVHNFKEFSEKLQTIVPQKTSKLRQMLGGKRFEMTTEEEKELENMDVEED